MLDTALLHPEILRVLARSGHHSKVLIADGNYPALDKRGAGAELVSLQLSPGIPTVAQVLAAILGITLGLSACATSSSYPLKTCVVSGDQLGEMMGSGLAKADCAFSPSESATHRL